jgi:hypothetical protein
MVFGVGNGREFNGAVDRAVDVAVDLVFGAPTGGFIRYFVHLRSTTIRKNNELPAHMTEAISKRASDLE